MSTGIFSNQFSIVRRHGFKALSLAVLGLGLVLGGCNGKLKDENEALRTENADLKEKVTSADTEKAAMSSTLDSTKAENARLAAAVAMANQPRPPEFISQGGNDMGNGGGGKQRASRGAESGNTTRIRISGDLLFASGSVTLKPDAKKELSSHLSELKNASKIVVEGYTDSDPVKKSKYGSNQALSKARADSVRDYLVSKGISKSRISTVGKGAAEPLANKKESRRVEIVVAE